MAARTRSTGRATAQPAPRVKPAPPMAWGDPDIGYLSRPFDEHELPANLTPSQRAAASALLPPAELREKLIWHRNAARAVRDARVKAGILQKTPGQRLRGTTASWLREFERGQSWAQFEEVLHVMAALGLSPSDVKWEQEPRGAAGRAPRGVTDLQT